MKPSFTTTFQEFTAAGLVGELVGRVVVDNGQPDWVVLDLVQSEACREDDDTGEPLDLSSLSATTIAEIESELLEYVIDNWTQYIEQAANAEAWAVDAHASEGSYA